MDERPTGGSTPSEGGKNKRRPSKEGGGDKTNKVGKTELCEMVSGAILGRPGVFASPFPLRLHVLQPNPSTRLILEEGEAGVVRVVPTSYVAGAVVSWLADERAPEYLATHRTAVEAVDFWADCAPKLGDQDVAPLLWPGEPGLTWHRMPWVLEPGPAPTWQGLIDRMTNAECFCDYIGSFFFKQANIHQYYWIRGRGHDGKGAINRFFARALGPCYRSKHPPHGGSDKFWTYGLIGVRMAAIPDCDNSKFVTSGLFKAITGGDPVDVEAKGQMSGTVMLNCKFLIFSNEKPAVGSNEADQRRILYSEFTAPGAYDAAFEDRLWAEGGAFLSGCIAGYLQRYPTHGAIKGDRELIEEIAFANEEEFEVLFQRLFVLKGAIPTKGPHSTHTLNSFTAAPQEVQDRLKMHLETKKMRSDFIDWMDRKYDVKSVSYREAVASTAAGKPVKRYRNCVLMDASQANRIRETVDFKADTASTVSTFLRLTT